VLPAGLGFTLLASSLELATRTGPGRTQIKIVAFPRHARDIGNGTPILK
jgi:hypothetical protein